MKPSPATHLRSTHSTTEIEEEKGLGRLNAYLPLLPLLVLGYLFLGGDFYPSIAPEAAGVEWQECRLAAETYSEIPNAVQAQRCFGEAPAGAELDGSVLPLQEAHKPFFIQASRPYRLSDKVLFIGKMGVKYFLMVSDSGGLGKKVGAAFDYIELETCCGTAPFAVQFDPARYVFRGRRGGNYYLVQVSVAK
jgi:hypothetical protein